MAFQLLYSQHSFFAKSWFFIQMDAECGSTPKNLLLFWVLFCICRVLYSNYSLRQSVHGRRFTLQTWTTLENPKYNHGSWDIFCFSADFYMENLVCQSVQLPDLSWKCDALCVLLFGKWCHRWKNRGKFFYVKN